jgi:RES domain
MAGSGPKAGFARVKLEIDTIPPGQRFRRLYLNLPGYHALGFGKTPSRFSDPRKRIASNRFGVLYLGTSLTVCFLEVFLRDKRNGAVGDFPLAEKELDARQDAEIINAHELRLVDLRGNRAIRMGVPSDVARASKQSIARAWSVGFYEHPEKPDGIIYPSRLNSETNLAIYDRAIPKLVVDIEMPLIRASGLASILNDLKVALAP